MPFTIYQLFHTSVFLMYVFTTYSMMSIRIPNATNLYKKFDPGHIKYLTIWNMIVQTLFFFVCMLNDWLGTNAVNPKKTPFMRKLKDYMHAVLSFPIAMFVGATFWGLMFVNRELVLPKALDPYLPMWLNHLMHTMIIVTTLIETFIAPRKYPRRLHGIAGEMTFLGLYLIWMHIIYYKNGVWVYPVMNAMSMPLRIVFFVVLFVFSIGLYIVGEALDNFVWGNQYIKHQKLNTKGK
ncbi:androgen-dependent TFPI-regulating protein isoform X2 [Xylocopa sonorina]|uniref:androgen-dependent TFPI-regulating protein isoform X2 n=1 Tax=Xylocopa sonorina TaxID=1818115 RepID=UPI00403AA457